VVFSPVFTGQKILISHWLVNSTTEMGLGVSFEWVAVAAVVDDILDVSFEWVAVAAVVDDILDVSFEWVAVAAGVVDILDVSFEWVAVAAGVVDILDVSFDGLLQLWLIVLRCAGAVWKICHLLPHRVHPSPLHRPPQGQTQRTNHQVATSVADPVPF
jgi:hypothetical protein